MAPWPRTAWRPRRWKHFWRAWTPGRRRRINIDYELQACVTHWRIYRAWRKEPYAAFGFTLCPIEDGEEHEVVNFFAADVPIEAAALGFREDT